MVLSEDKDKMMRFTTSLPEDWREDSSSVVIVTGPELLQHLPPTQKNAWHRVACGGSGL
jgi:hypothetical protein